MGKPTLTWSTSSGVLFNNTFVADTSPPASDLEGNPIPGIPVTNYQRTRQYTSYETTPPSTPSDPNPSPVINYHTDYTSTNPSNNNLIAIKGGVYEKAEFITSQSGASAKPTTGNPVHQNNVVFIMSGETYDIGGGVKRAANTVGHSQGPILPSGPGPAGANIEANVGWTGSTLNATAGFHTNTTSTPFDQGGTSPYSGLGPAPASFITGRTTLESLPSGMPYQETITSEYDFTDSSEGGTGPAPGAGSVVFPGNSGRGPSFSGIYQRSKTYSPSGNPAPPSVDKPIIYNVSSNRVEMWAPQLAYSLSTYKATGSVKFEIAKDKGYQIHPLSALTVTGTASIAPFGVGGGRTGSNSDINAATHAKVTVTTSSNHNLADSNNRIYVTGASQVQMNGWHYVYDVTDEDTFSYIIPLSLSGGQSVSGTFTVETYDGIDKPGGVLKTDLQINKIMNVRRHTQTGPHYFANGDTYMSNFHNYRYKYIFSSSDGQSGYRHGFQVGDEFTVAGTEAYSGLKTVDFVYSDGVEFVRSDGVNHVESFSGTYSETVLYSGTGIAATGPVKGTVRAGGNAGNNRVIMSHDSNLQGEYKFYPNTSYANAVYEVSFQAELDSNSSLFTAMGLEIDEDTGVLSSNGAYDGVNNKGVRSLDSFFPKFLDARNKALNTTVTTGSITQSNNTITLNNLERLPTGHLKEFRYANGLTTDILEASVATLDTDDDGNVINYSAFEIASGNTATDTRAAVKVGNNIGDENTITENDYTLTYVDNSFPVANSSAFFSIQKQNNTPIVSGTEIVAFVGPDEQFNVPVWGALKAYKDPNHYASDHGVSDSDDVAYQEFCIKVYKNMNADRDDTIVVYSDPDNAEEPVDANTAFTFTQDEEEIPITNAQFLANSYANSSLKHF